MRETTLFVNELDLAEWLGEVENGTAHYWNLVIIKYESNVIVLDEHEEILAKIETADQQYYGAAEKIDSIAMCY